MIFPWPSPDRNKEQLQDFVVVDQIGFRAASYAFSGAGFQHLPHLLPNSTSEEEKHFFFNSLRCDLVKVNLAKDTTRSNRVLLILICECDAFLVCSRIKQKKIYFTFVVVLEVSSRGNKQKKNWFLFGKNEQNKDAQFFLKLVKKYSNFFTNHSKS